MGDMSEKTFKFYKEKHGGIFVGLVIAVIIFISNPNIHMWKDFFRDFLQIGIFIFGFLLTLLGIILQGNSKTIKWMVSNEELYKRFINFHKRIILMSISLTFLSLFLSHFNFTWLFSYLVKYDCCFNIVIRLLITFFMFLFSWLIHDIFIFLKYFICLSSKITNKLITIMENRDFGTI